MKTFRHAAFFIGLISIALYSSSCKKSTNTTAPATTTPTNPHPAGSVDGTVTFNGASAVTVSGSSTNSQYGYVMSARNMSPPNSYPSINISFSGKPTKDSTYALSPYNSASIYMSSDTQNDGYSAYSGGNIVVTVSGGVITAKITNVTFNNSFSGNKVGSATLNAY